MNQIHLFLLTIPSKGFFYPISHEIDYDSFIIVKTSRCSSVILVRRNRNRKRKHRLWSNLYFYKRLNNMLKNNKILTKDI
ncbi:MAG: hypothetical protein A2Y79_01880 [Deltaproteobacteria bacterium RBG_13_43_22]|nr:MAG: hypothetical protein A2Y79_01880 [Deltaproteobacteria bacterium RBG_13_43_22]